MGKILVIATFNPHKLGELRALLPGLSAELRALSAFPGAEPAVEDGETLEANALKKALAAARFTGLPALADDTGLEVDALAGEPGVRSARYAGEKAAYSDNNAKLLAALAGVPPAGRAARFACVTALALPSGEVSVSRGVLEGSITAAARGGNGFGYDPLFEVKGGPRTLAQFSEDEKNAVSHRAAALKGLLPALLRLFPAG
ncbi:MAG: non-canonical purine NTP pyrophosphatase, RdgB/HAM1 family [Elusimicrobia bacterium GWC2_64_44]|nr:MAG: non-canonical purine NTP pyrophosphatase, RdgB/HAM1 family [Elusimicrobia bacterium GWC2_64_44]